MSAEEVLRSNESKALSGSQFVSSVAGKGKGKMKGGKKAKAIGAGVFIIGMLAIPMFIFGFGNFAPVALSERLVEETDVQYADEKESKQLAFQKYLKKGEVPENTRARLEENGVLVGNVDSSGNFVESADGKSLKIGDKIISADNFYDEVNKNVELYSAFDNATYGRAAYYYDERAQSTFNDLGVTRNSYNSDSDFEEVMDGIMGEGSDVTVNSIESGTCEKEVDGKKVTEECPKESPGASSKGSAQEFVKQVSDETKSSSTSQATSDAASSLETADIETRKQRSSKFYVGIMENISKMKAGEGSEAKLNEAMNYLYRDEESTVIDTQTGQPITVKGSAMESPSLFAVLSGENINAENIKNYNSERVMDTIKNQMQNGSYNTNESYSGTITSSDLKQSSVGRYVSNYVSAADIDTLDRSNVSTMINSSMIDNSFKTIKGVSAGEMLVEGAVNVGASLAQDSGATVGDDAAVNEYAKLTNMVLAMDAEADRLNRSPLDITSKNTFLGALVRKFAVETIRSGSFLNQVASFAKVTANAATSLISVVRADEENNSFMKPYNGCERYENIDATSMSSCWDNMTSDTSTLKSNIYEDTNYKAWYEANINKDTGKPYDNSTAAYFLKYQYGRKTPVGITDAGILESLNTNSTSDGSGGVPFVRKISQVFQWIKNLLGINNKETEKNNKIASGAAFVNSKNNPYWEGREDDGSIDVKKAYKYAQRWVSLTRAEAALRQYEGGENACVDEDDPLQGKEPIIAFFEDLESKKDSIASND